MSPKVVRVYFDCDMRMGVYGLTEMLQTKRIAVDNMREADFVLFLNRKKTHFKMLCGAGYLVAFKSSKYLTMEDIERVPELFGSDKSMLQGRNFDKVNEVVKDLQIVDIKHVS